MCKLCEFTEKDKPHWSHKENVVGVKTLDDNQYTGLYLFKYDNGIYSLIASDQFEASFDINYCPECGMKLKFE